MRLIALSDTHTRHVHVEVPDGDVLIFAGDMMSSGYRAEEMHPFLEWFSGQPHRHKILVGGNHDRILEREGRTAVAATLRAMGIHYLCDDTCEIGSVSFFGSPYTPAFMGWAFQLPRDDGIDHWRHMPQADVVITHGPPLGICDGFSIPLIGSESSTETRLGDENLLKAIARTAPKVHIFGHIHAGHGQDQREGVRFYNVAICDEQYRPVNPVTVIEL